MNYLRPIAMGISVVSLGLSLIAYHKASHIPQAHRAGAGFFEGQYLPYGSPTGSIVYSNDAGTWNTLDAGDAGMFLATGGSGGAIPYWTTLSGTTLPDGGTGAIWYQSDAGTVQALPTPAFSNELLQASPNIPPNWTTITGYYLSIPGTIVAPGSTASGWAFFNNGTGGNAATETDVATGIEITVPQTFPSFGGYVETGSGTSTMSVEVACTYFSTTGAAFAQTQSMWAGAAMYESSSGRYLNWHLAQSYSNGSSVPSQPIANYLNDAGLAKQLVTYGNAAFYHVAFMRLRLSGSNVLAEISMDRVTYGTVQTIPINVAFVTKPDKVGIGFNPATFGPEYITCFHFVTT